MTLGTGRPMADDGAYDLSPEARRDLAKAADYLAERSVPRGRRLIAAAMGTFAKIAARPGLGARVEFAEDLYPGLRCRPIERHKNHLIFYRPTAEGVKIMRIIHGARDVEAILAGDAGES